MNVHECTWMYSVTYCILSHFITSIAIRQEFRLEANPWPEKCDPSNWSTMAVELLYQPSYGKKIPCLALDHVDLHRIHIPLSPRMKSPRPCAPLVVSPHFPRQKVWWFPWRWWQDQGGKGRWDWQVTFSLVQLLPATLLRWWSENLLIFCSSQLPDLDVIGFEGPMAQWFFSENLVGIYRNPLSYWRLQDG